MTHPRGETEAKSSGFDATMEAAFDWLADHAKVVMMGVGGLVLAGAVWAGTHELNQRSEEVAQFSLAKVEMAFASAMGSSEMLVTEPANPEQARKAREEALAGFESVITEHSGTRAQPMAQLRAAEMELDLGHSDAAEQRLMALIDMQREADPLRAVALRLRGYIQEQEGRFLDAGESYAEAARSSGYPAHGMMWMAAGASFARARAFDRAIDAYQEVLSADPGLAEAEGIVDRLNRLMSLEPIASLPSAP